MDQLYCYFAEHTLPLRHNIIRYDAHEKGPDLMYRIFITSINARNNQHGRLRRITLLRGTTSELDIVPTLRVLMRQEYDNWAIDCRE